MGRARDVMDAITAAVMAGDASAIAACYAVDAVADTPDAGRIEGRDAIADYLMSFAEAFSDMGLELTEGLEVGEVAIDEGFLLGRHTGVLRTPDGDIPPTGKRIRVRSCDIATVRDGVAVSHRFYYDQLDFLAQLGLVDPQQVAAGLPAQRVDPTGSKVSQQG